MWRRARPAVDDYEAAAYAELRRRGWSPAADESPRATPFPGRFLFQLEGEWEVSAWVHVFPADSADKAATRGTAFLLGVDAGVTYPPAERLLASLGVRTSNLTAPAPDRFAGDFEDHWIELASVADATSGADRLARHLEDVVVPWARTSLSTEAWARRCAEDVEADGGDPEAFAAMGRIAMNLAHGQAPQALDELARLDHRLLRRPNATEKAFSASARQRIARGVVVPKVWSAPVSG